MIPLPSSISDTFIPTYQPLPPSKQPPRPQKPSSLVTLARNGWLFNKSTDHKKPRMNCNLILACITAPRFRRYLIVYFVLLFICGLSWVGLASPQLKEHGDLVRALDVKNRQRVGGWFGANSLPRFVDMVHMKTLDERLVPSETPGEESSASGERKRLVVVGDVHGCKDELERLLDKVAFDRRAGDHLIFTGDLIGKGPDNVGVVQLAREYGASCVRGNNEDRVLLYRRELLAAGILSGSDPDAKLNPGANTFGVNRGGFIDQEADKLFPYGDSKDHMLAQELSDDDAEWLHNCPVILRLGRIAGMGETVVVHAGLLPGVELERQDPFAVMTMRSLDLDTHVPSSKRAGLSWAKIFNKHQTQIASQLQSTPSSDQPDTNASAPQPTTVIYGHTPQNSPAIKKYTKGLDTGCVKGGKLTALVIETGGKTKVQQVKCKDYVSRPK